MKRSATAVLTTLCAFSAGCAPAASPGSPHEAEARACEARGELRAALTHYVAAIQALPEGDASANDLALRERAIGIALSLDPPPAIPEDIQSILHRADARAAEAKGDVAREAAASDYARVLRHAPWHAQATFNLGLLHEAMNRPQDAVRCLKLYLLAAPQAQDRDAVQRRVATLEARLRSTGVGGLEGDWRISGFSNNYHFAYCDNHGKWRREPSASHFRIRVQGSALDVAEVWDTDEGTRLKGDEIPFARLDLKGRRLSGNLTPAWRKSHTVSDASVQGIVSEDFADIRLSYSSFETGGESYCSSYHLTRER